MGELPAALGHAVAMAFGMRWEILWALVLGFALSAVVQAVVSKRALVVGLAILGAAVVAVGCGERSDSVADRPYGRMELGLRRAEERARAGDAAGARREFFDDAHEPLHRLASETAGQDRASAARLLEAKQSVERSLAEASPTLTDDLDRLERAAREALAVAGPNGSSPRGRP